MSAFVAALPMYDWPEMRGEVDAHWASVRDRLRAAGVEAPDRLTRRNGDLPALNDGSAAAVNPSLGPDQFDLQALWRHPRLLVAQTCWGPLETTGLLDHVTILGQPSYEGIEGGTGALYSSAILMRKGTHPDAAPDLDGCSSIPLDRLRKARFAFNEPGSMSGCLALSRDLDAMGESLDIFSARVGTGAHRASIVAVAEGRADVCTIDCRSWALARRFEPRAADLAVVGWTGRRKGLPFITARQTPDALVAILRDALGLVARPPAPG